MISQKRWVGGGGGRVGEVEVERKVCLGRFDTDSLVIIVVFDVINMISTTPQLIPNGFP